MLLVDRPSDGHGFDRHSATWRPRATVPEHMDPVDGTAAAHLAQYNVARLRHPIGHPATADFEALIDETNHRAEASPGFVWRHGIDSRDIDVTAYDDPLVLVNASVWESAAHLRDYAYRGFHRDVYRRRQEWFVDSAAVMWWIPAGTVPTLDECRARLAFHQRHGSTPYGFGTGERHPQLVLRRHDRDEPIVAELFAQLDAELAAERPAGAVDFVQFDAPDDATDEAVHGEIVVAWMDDRPVGCGAWRRIDDDAGRPRTAEIKRMWVDPSARGRRVGAALLDELETAAARHGADELRLETGRYLTAAMRLYTEAGFGECAAWGDYIDVPHSVTLAKTIDEGQRKRWRPTRPRTDEVGPTTP